MALKKEPITQDDIYSNNLERRKLYWLQNSSSEVDRFLGSVVRDLSALPQNSRATLQTGESGSNIVYLTTITQAVPALQRE